jgi:hypothetical protein
MHEDTWMNFRDSARARPRLDRSGDVNAIRGAKRSAIEPSQCVALQRHMDGDDYAAACWPIVAAGFATKEKTVA